MTPVIPDVVAKLRKKQRDEWPRPGDVPCACGGRAFQCGLGSTSYLCLRCDQSQCVWTGFDDPVGFERHPVNLDPKTLRFLALMSAPLFTLLSTKLGVTVPLEVQELLVGTVALYLLGSHGKEALIESAKAKAAGAAAAITTPEQAAAALADPKVTP